MISSVLLATTLTALSSFQGDVPVVIQVLDIEDPTKPGKLLSDRIMSWDLRNGLVSVLPGGAVPLDPPIKMKKGELKLQANVPQDVFQTPDLTLVLVARKAGTLSLQLPYAAYGANRFDGGTLSNAIIVERSLAGFVHTDGVGTLKTNLSGSGRGAVGMESNHSLDVLTTNQARMTIDENGDVGIGTTSPSARFHVEGANGGQFQVPDFAPAGNNTQLVGTFIGPNFAPQLRFEGRAGTWADIGQNTNGDFVIEDSFDVGRIVVQDGTGNVGIGTETPGFLLEVNGSAGKPGGGSWSTASDRRLKEGISTLEGSLERLLSLHGVSFRYRNPEAIHELPGERMGMIAQQVQEVFPDWVHTAQDGYLRLTFRGFEALVVEALRDLRQEKDEQIAALERANEQLRTQLQDVLRTAESTDSRLAALEAFLATSPIPGKR